MQVLREPGCTGQRLGVWKQLPEPSVARFQVFIGRDGQFKGFHNDPRRLVRLAPDDTGLERPIESFAVLGSDFLRDHCVKTFGIQQEAVHVIQDATDGVGHVG